MDLGDLVGKTFELLKSNLILFLPPLVMTYLVPTILGIVAVLVFVPILVAAANYPQFVSALTIGAIIGIATLVVAAVILLFGIIAGQANMNKKAVLTGKTHFADFNEGVRKYLSRIFGGYIAIILIYTFFSAYLLLIFIGLGGDFAAGATLVQNIIQKLSVVKWNFGAIQMTEWLEFLQVMTRFIGIVFCLVALGFLVYLFTLTWIPACLIEEVGVLKAIRLSTGFVARNFYTALGYLGLYVIANSFTSRIFPGWGGGGGWGGDFKLPFISMTGGGGFGFAMPAPLTAVFNLLITTFFTLLLYVMYADRTGKLITARPPSTIPVAFRPLKKE